MKTPSYLTRIATITGLALGAFALSAFATGTWTGPGCAPPGCNTDAPINVGATTQYKTGAIGLGSGTIDPKSDALLQVFGNSIINTLGVSNLYVLSGDQTAGNVLTIDSTGKAYWAKPTSGGSTPPTGSQVYSTQGNYSWTVPAGVTSAIVEVWGGGGGGQKCSVGGNFVYYGGGSGAYGKSTVTVTGGQVINGVVGAGGASDFASTNSNSGPGTASSFGSLIAGAGQRSQCGGPDAGTGGLVSVFNISNIRGGDRNGATGGICPLTGPCTGGQIAGSTNGGSGKVIITY